MRQTDITYAYKMDEKELIYKAGLKGTRITSFMNNDGLITICTSEEVKEEKE